MSSKEFNNIIYKLRPKLILFARGFIRESSVTAEDMVQDSIIKVWGSIQNGERIQKIEAYILSILKNRCLDHLKLHKNQTEPLEKVSINTVNNALTPIQVIELNESLKLISIIIYKLPHDQQIALRLRDVLGYEIEDIAEILKTNSQNTRKIISRARIAIREQINN